jgi:hypothetical protein
MAIPVAQIINDWKRDAVFTKEYRKMCKAGIDYREIRKAADEMMRNGWGFETVLDNTAKMFLYTLMELERIGFEVVSYTVNKKVRLTHSFGNESQYKTLQRINEIPCQVATIQFSKGAIWVNFSEKGEYIQLPEVLPECLSDI